MRPDLVMEIGRRAVVVSTRAAIRSDHLMAGVDDSRILGRVKAHPDDRHRWGLENVSDTAWIARSEGGEEYTVAPGYTIELQAGMKVRLDSAVVIVRVP